MASAEKIAAPGFQAWLHEQEPPAERNLRLDEHLAGTRDGRTKEDIAAIRHVYLDIDENGTEAVGGLLKRPDLPSRTTSSTAPPTSGRWCGKSRSLLKSRRNASKSPGAPDGSRSGRHGLLPGTCACRASTTTNMTALTSSPSSRSAVGHTDPGVPEGLSEDRDPHSGSAAQ